MPRTGMIAAQDVTGGTSYYVYDGSGERVRRVTGGAETWEIYGFDGELIAEYAANSGIAAPQKEYGYRNGQLLIVASGGANIHWLISDHLGTPRIVLDATGSLAGVSRHDYMPFGEELYAGVGGRTQAQGYTNGDGARQKFTSKERDAETGLDYFLARYYSPSLGRFTSPDPSDTSSHQKQAQSWNKYSYVMNEPLKLIDPDGEMWIYRYIDETHIGITWIDGNSIPPALRSRGYRELKFERGQTRDITLTDGMVVRLSAVSNRAEVLRKSQETGDRGYVNQGLINELARQTAPMPKATAVFILVSLNGGYAIAGSSIALLDAAAFTLNAVHEQSENDAQVMATTSSQYQDTTNPGSIRNIKTDVSKADFIKNMEASGYNVTRQGNVVFLDKGGNRYTVYDSPKNGPSAQSFRGGEPVVKIRLKP